MKRKRRIHMTIASCLWRIEKRVIEVIKKKKNFFFEVIEETA